MSTLQPPNVQNQFSQSVSTFSARFGTNDDQATVTQEQRQIRQQTAAEGTDQYYDFATSAYENGWGQHFHYGPYAPGETIHEAMIFYEHRFAHLLGLKPGMKVLDVGCGIGGPAREIAKLIGCEIVGITINQGQVNRASALTAQAGLEDKCIFIKGDFLNLPFPDASFDAAYAIEATVHAPSLVKVYSGIARVLKPGAPVGISEWVLTPNFDPNNSKHIGIRNRIERGNAISNLQTSDQCRTAMTDAGFDIYHDEDYATHWTTLGCSTCRPSIPGFPSIFPAIDSSDTPPHEQASDSTPSIPPPISRPWYWPMDGQTKLAISGSWPDYSTPLMMTRPVRKICFIIVWILEHLHLYPQGTLAAMTTMAYCVDSVVEAGKDDIFTPCWWFIGQKRDVLAEATRIAGLGEDVVDGPKETSEGNVGVRTDADAAKVAAFQAWSAHEDQRQGRAV